ncbi:MAG: ATPase domain-containing protein, partial [Thermoplasmata archaeon]
ELERRLKAELAEKEREYLDKEAEMKRQVIDLEGEVERHKIEAKLKAEAMELSGQSGKDINAELTEKARELQLKERDVILKEQEMERLREELAVQQDEVNKLKEPLGYKEEELLRREEDLIYREKLLEQDKKRSAAARNQASSVEEAKLKERLETLKSEISQKEEEVRAKEAYLTSKMDELRLREQGLIEEDIEAREEERALEFKVEKVKTGTPRLDDLLLGGIPFGSNVSVYGPPFIGKEVMVNAFVAEGLKKGVPAIWVITDKTPDDIRDEMQYVVPGYEEYENLGLVRYIDAYSKGMGATTEDPYATYIDDPTDQAAILEAVDRVATEIMSEHKTYRLAFRSISTLMAYLDPASTFRFLQPFAGRRKRDKAVTLYVIEKGMHGEQDIQMLGSLMDGMVDFKVEQLKTYVSVKGISDAQSRAWIQYMYSKQGLSIGSFTLDHIR